MENEKDHRFFTYTLPIFSIAATPAILIALIVGVYINVRDTNDRFDQLEHNLNEQSKLIALATEESRETDILLTSTDQSLRDALNIIEENLSLTKSESQALADALAARLTAEQQKVAELQQETEKIGGTVGTLEKLSQTDPELLKKYSKVYFLNEHYVPSGLAEIKNAYLYSERKTQYIHKDVLHYLTTMLDDAKAEGVTIYVKSAYRSFNEQDNLKDSYNVTYGADTANTFSADQGYSEHQLGTTVDLITTGLGGQLDGFENTVAYTWLIEHAHEYGFTLSYPQHNEFYVFEPWHWRFVGKELATRLYNEKRGFYDLEQRVIDEYLVSIFD